MQSGGCCESHNCNEKANGVNEIQLKMEAEENDKACNAADAKHMKTSFDPDENKQQGCKAGQKYPEEKEI